MSTIKPNSIFVLLSQQGTQKRAQIALPDQPGARASPAMQFFWQLLQWFFGHFPAIHRHQLPPQHHGQPPKPLQNTHGSPHAIFSSPLCSCASPSGQFVGHPPPQATSPYHRLPPSSLPFPHLSPMTVIPDFSNPESRTQDDNFINNWVLLYGFYWFNFLSKSICITLSHKNYYFSI